MYRTISLSLIVMLALTSLPALASADPSSSPPSSQACCNPCCEATLETLRCDLCLPNDFCRVAEYLYTSSGGKIPNTWTLTFFPTGALLVFGSIFYTAHFSNIQFLWGFLPGFGLVFSSVAIADWRELVGSEQYPLLAACCSSAPTLFPSLPETVISEQPRSSSAKTSEI